MSLYGVFEVARPLGLQELSIYIILQIYQQSSPWDENNVGSIVIVSFVFLKVISRYDTAA